MKWFANRTLFFSQMLMNPPSFFLCTLFWFACPNSTRQHCDPDEDEAPRRIACDVSWGVDRIFLAKHILSCFAQRSMRTHMKSSSFFSACLLFYISQPQKVAKQICAKLRKTNIRKFRRTRKCRVLFRRKRSSLLADEAADGFDTIGSAPTLSATSTK